MTVKLHFDEEQAFPLAREKFIATCGFDLEKPKHKRMMSMGMKVREDGVAGIDINAVVETFDKSHFQDHSIRINGEELKCPFFEQIPDEAVEKIYFYVLTVGECYFSSEENIMDFLYADIWGTNYVDSGTSLMREEIVKKMKEEFLNSGKDVFLSMEFGPGYFGMPVIETKKFTSILDSSQIGVRVKDSGLMIPQKSCTGFYLALNDRNIKFENDCVKCSGNQAGCQFCRIFQEMNKKVD